LQISISIGKSYFVEIAKLRALRILWNNVLQAYGATLAPAEIVVSFTRDSQDENIHTNMIRAATQTMSAVIGGADRIYVLPANAATGVPSDAFTRRIARNVQHLLQLESYFDKVIDPAAGSYYIEKMTELLAQNAWSQFQRMEKDGDFKY
jgi:methylmalonyl-CoA mutase